MNDFLLVVPNLKSVDFLRVKLSEIVYLHGPRLLFFLIAWQPLGIFLVASLSLLRGYKIVALDFGVILSRFSL